MSAAAEFRNPFMKLMSEVPVVSITGEGSGSVIYVSPETTLKQALAVLNTNQISSVPVVDSSGHAAGFVDVLDIIEYIVSTLKSTKSSVDISKYTDTVLSTEVRSIIDFSRRDFYAFISGSETMDNVSKLLASGVIRRCATGVKSASSAVHDVPLGICSQIDVINFLSDELKDETNLRSPIHEMAKITLGGYLFGLEKKHFQSIDSKATLLDACALIVDNSLSLLAITDAETGVICGSFSPEDIRSWEASDFLMFNKPVLEYLHKKSSRSLKPLIIEPVTTFESAIHMIATTKVHGFFVVNESNIPVSVLTLTDLLRMITEASLV